MQTRLNINTKKHDDLKVIITATALTLTLAFWNLFSNGAQKPIQTVSIVPTIIPPQMAQVKILLGGPPPKTTVFVSQPKSSQHQVQRQAQQSAPQPVANTGSSK